MRCPRCNRETKDGTVFCPGCGAPLSFRSEPSAPALDATLDLDRRAADEIRAPPLEPRPAAPAARPATAAPPRVPQARTPAPAAPPSRAVPPARTVPPPVPPSRGAPIPTQPPRAAAPPRAAPPSPAVPRPESRPPAVATPRPPEPPPPPVQEPSQWDMRLSQMPRERRLDLGPEPSAPARPVLWTRPRSESELEEPSGEVVIAPVEVHLRRAPDWKRLLAWVLDAIPFAALFAFAMRLALDRLPHAAPLDLATALDLAGAEALGITLPIFAGILVIFAVYHALAHGMSGGTLGKRLVGIRVVGPDGKRPGLGRATVRAVLGVISLLLLGLGVLLALFTRSGRALHDLLARTWVVEAS